MHSTRRAKGTLGMRDSRGGGWLMAGECWREGHVTCRHPGVGGKRGCAAKGESAGHVQQR